MTRVIRSISLALPLLLGACEENYVSMLDTATVSVSHVALNLVKQPYTVRPGERFQIADSDYYGVIENFVPDFSMSPETGDVISRSKSPRNPAVKISLYQGEKRIYSRWVLKGVPDDHLIRAPGIVFYLVDVKLKEK